MSELLLTGLDAKNPLGFLAALGVLNALADRERSGRLELRLAWRFMGTHRPAIVDGPDHEELIEALLEDAVSFRHEPAIERLRYSTTKGEAHDLKPPPEIFASYLRGLIAGGSRRSLSFASAFATDMAVDNNKHAKPTALHFTAGQQEFLTMVGELSQGVNKEDFEEALFGPWRYRRPLPVLQWDNSTARDYALRASDPSTEKKLGVPGADWLAFRGLPFIRVAPVGQRIVTTGVRGEWKSGAFRWPIWTEPLCRSVIAALLSSPELFDLDPKVLRMRGIALVLESAIRRSDQGGYGSFSPARVARPGDRGAKPRTRS